MSLLRSRLVEFYNRVARDDMITLFSSIAKFQGLEVSVILQNAQVISPHIKYQAACVLEILTGQRPTLDEIELENEYLTNCDNLKSQEMIRSIMLQAGRTLTTDELKLLSSAKGIRLKTNLNRVNMFNFLEKAHEFYLPDLASVDHVARKSCLEDGINSYFKKPSRKNRTDKPREKLEEGDNPSLATAAYTLKSSDLLKFPDIELYFEPLHTVLGSGGSSEKDNNLLSTNSLQLFIRPEINVTNTFEEKFVEHLKGRGKLNNLKVMNYFLSLFFNPYGARSTY